MKLLFLVRHAKSSWDNPKLDDHDRPLSERGMKNAPEMAFRLDAWQLGPQLIVSSTALRAAQTASFFAQGLSGKPILEACSSLYTDSPAVLLEVIQNSPNEIDRLMIVGHNPAMNELISQLDFDLDNLPTCGVIVFGLEIDSWKDIDNEPAIALYYDYPKRKKPKMNHSGK